MQFFETLAKLLPRLRTPIQLTGLAVLVAGYLVTRAAAPEQVHAQISVGAIGVVIIVFGQVFHFLKDIPEQQRVNLVIVLFVVFLVFVLLIIGLTGYFLMNRDAPATVLPQLSVQRANKDQAGDYTVRLEWKDGALHGSDLFWELFPGDSGNPDNLPFERSRGSELPKDRNFKDVSVLQKHMPKNPRGRLVAVPSSGAPIRGDAQKLNGDVTYH